MWGGAAGRSPPPALLRPTECLDLRELLRRELARDLAAGYLLRLDVAADLVDDLGVCQGARVSDVGEVGDSGDDPPHDLAGARLWHVRDDPDVLWPGDCASRALDRRGHFPPETSGRGSPGLERHVDLQGPAAKLVQHRDRRGLGDLIDCKARRLELFGSEPMPGHVDDVVDAPEDPEVAVRGLERAVAREVRPVVPVRAGFVLAVLLVVDLHEPLWLTPDRLEDAGPRVADADVPRPTPAGLDHPAVLVIDYRVDPKDPWPAAAGLHRLGGGEGAAQKPAVFGLPPGVNDDRRVFADDIVVPAHHLRFDRLPARSNR